MRSPIAKPSSGPPTAASRSGPRRCASCSRKWSGSTITSTTSAIFATRRRSRSERRKASFWRRQAKQLNARLTGSRFLRSLLVPGGLRRDLDPGQWLGDGLESLREEFATYVGQARELRKPSRSPDHHGSASATGGVRPGRDRTCAARSGIDRDLRRDHPYAHYAGPAADGPRRSTTATLTRASASASRKSKPPFVLCQRVLLLLEPGRHSRRLRARASCRRAWDGRRGRAARCYYAVHVGADGRLARVKIKSPSFSNWRAFPFTVHDTNMMDYAINEASFGLTVAGCDR